MNLQDVSINEKDAKIKSMEQAITELAQENEEKQ